MVIKKWKPKVNREPSGNCREERIHRISSCFLGVSAELKASVVFYMLTSKYTYRHVLTGEHAEETGTLSLGIASSAGHNRSVRCRVAFMRAVASRTGSDLA